MDDPIAVIKTPSDFFYQPTYEWKAPVSFDIFVLTFPTFPTLAAASAVAAGNTQQVVVPNEADFECRRIYYHADVAAAAVTVSTAPFPHITMSLNDTGSSRNLQNLPFPMESLCCSMQAPRDLPWPRIFVRTATISIQLINFDAAQTPSIRIAMVGRKIFNRSGGIMPAQGAQGA